MTETKAKTCPVYRISRRKFLLLFISVTSQFACRQRSQPVAGWRPKILDPAKTPPATAQMPALSSMKTLAPTADESASLVEAGETSTPVEATIETKPLATETPVSAQPETDSNEDPAPETVSSSTTPAPMPVIIVDAHQDIAWNWLEFGRDPADDALDGRSKETGNAVRSTMGQRTTGLPQWLAGRIGIIFSSIFVMPSRHAYGKWTSQTYVTPEEAHTKALEQLEANKRLADQNSNVQLIETSSNLNEVVNSWKVRGAPQASRVGLVLLMEGADPIREPGEVLEWYGRGLRIVGPAWKSTRYSGGTGEPGPLTPLGWELLEAMAGVGMILDLSHMAEAAYLAAIDSYQGPVIASHSNPREFLPTDRGLSDEMIRLLAGQGGVLGITPYNPYLKPGWKTGDPRSEVTMQIVVDAIDYVVQLTGSSEHVGIGSDFDGGFGLASIPFEMDTIADLLKIVDVLDSRGYGAKDIELIMSGNWLRVLRYSLPNVSSNVSIPLSQGVPEEFCPVGVT